MTDFEQAVLKLQQYPFLPRLVNALTFIEPGQIVENFGVKYLPRADCIYLYGRQGPYVVRLILNPDRSTALEVRYDTSEEHMVNVESPKDARDQTEPPCVICGQPEAGHPTLDGFHKYQKPGAPATADPSQPGPTEGGGPPAGPA